MTGTPIGVLGLGNFGTALAQHLASRGFRVCAWTLSEALVTSINSSHRHNEYLQDVELHSAIIATTNIQEVLDSCGTILLVLPSAALPEVLPGLSIAPETLLISCVKGLVGDSLETPLQAIARYLSPCPRLAVLSGPSFARDIVKGLPCGLVAASSEEADALEVARLLSNTFMKVYHSTDPLGVELGGILKNVIALAVGIADGLGHGDSARAGLITRGLAEMTRLAAAMGARKRTLSGLSGMGDLVLTATCDTSRNRTVGLRLGKGESLDHIIATLGSTAEGVRTAPFVKALADKYAVEMPITDHACMVLDGTLDPKDALQHLMSRPLKKEHTD